MSSLFQAANNLTTTDNGVAAFKSTTNACLDYFFHAPALRGNPAEAMRKFSAAYAENPELALRILQWLRDVRGGAGVRQLFLDVLSFHSVGKETIPQEVLVKLVHKVPEIGRFKDLLCFAGTRMEEEAFTIIKTALEAGNGLCAKWMPRQGEVANKLRKFLGIKTPKEYRKLLVSLSDTVEQKICAQEWDQIAFDKLPSLAAKRYQSLFNKHAAERYAQYKADLEVGDTKVNAATLYPHDCIVATKHGDEAVAQAQWNALPNYLEGVEDRILPVVDVSPSMDCGAGTGSNYQRSAITCMDVAIALGLYLSERNEGIFHNKFVTFHSNPTFVQVSGSLRERFNQAKRSAWGGSTNLERTFEVLLNAAVTHNLPEDQMPTKILILSDMQFDQAVYRPTESLFQNIEKQYADAGYKRPQIVFWNINSSGGNVPITLGMGGTGLVSGFSPSVMKGVLSGELDPMNMMMSIVGNPRYDL